MQKKDIKEQKNSIEKISSVFFATFSLYINGKREPRNGMVEPMSSYFLPRVKTFLLLDQPHPISDTIDPFVEIYKNSKLDKKYRISGLLYYPISLFCKMQKKGLTRISYKIRDFFSVLYVGLTQKNMYDLFVGLEGINALAGIILKKIGKVKKVVYYVSDYSPNRFTKFGKKSFNSLYLWLDTYCVEHADFTWDVSPAILQARIKAGLDPEKAKKVVHVPNALFPSQIKSLPISKRKSNCLVYMGCLEPDFGVELAIEAFDKVKKKIPNALLRIIGGGDDLSGLKLLSKKLRLEKSVIFYGTVADNDEMSKIIRTSSIGLAPYRAYPESVRWYGDAGKIRQYLASGLPVVTTHVPPLGRYITEKGAGVLTRDTADDFSKGIIKLLSDKSFYSKLSKVAREISRKNTWENVYSQTLKQMNMTY